MIDLFGLGKTPEQPQEPAAEPAVSEAPPRGSHKLWAFLLVLDSVFVIVFAGTVAAKIYQHWKAPVLAPVAAPRRRPVKAVETPAASAPEPAPTPEPVKPPEPPKPPEAKVAAKPEAPRPPKPSMLADAPKHRGTPALADAGGKAPPSAPAASSTSAPVKALRTEFKLNAPQAKSVELIGAFIVRGGRKDMSKSDDGTWTVTLYLNPGSYRYFFSVDKKKQLDPENPHSEKGASLLSIP